MMYPVFQVDTYFSSWGMEFYLVGALNEEDVKSHLDKIFEGQVFTPEEKRKLQTEEYRIEKIDGLFTEEPYKVITSYGYME